MAPTHFFSKPVVSSVRFIIEHTNTPFGSWSRLEDTETIAQLHGIAAHAEEEAMQVCMRLLKSKNRRSQNFRVVKYETTRQVVKEVVKL